MTDQPTPPGDEEEPVPPHVRIQREILNNAAEIKGADFANYAACCIELAQVGAILKKLADRSMPEERASQLSKMGVYLVHSIDTKIYTEMSVEDRIEAGKCATRVLKAVEQAGG